MEISFSTSFKKTFKKLVSGKKEIESLFWEKTNLFISDPYNNSLKTHKLSGKLKKFIQFFN